MRTLVVLVALAMAVSAAAQDLVTNGGFDTDVAGWSQTNVGSGYFEWSSLDAAADPGSGSARVVNNDFPAFSLALVQCVPVTAGQRYDAAATLYIPSGQASSGFTYLRVEWSSLPACGGGWLGTESHPNLTDTGVWTTQSLTGLVAPATAEALQIQVFVTKTTTGGQLEVNVDDVAVTGPELLRDDFESGGLAAWSAAVP